MRWRPLSPREQRFSATSRFADILRSAFDPIKKISRPSPPALGHSRNAKQPRDFIATLSVNAKYVTDGETMRRPLDDPDLITRRDTPLDD
jgi:hypothetical protein